MGREDEGPIHTHSELSCPGCGVDGCRERYAARPPEEDESPLPFVVGEESWSQWVMDHAVLCPSDDPKSDYPFADEDDDE